MAIECKQNCQLSFNFLREHVLIDVMDYLSTLQVGAEHDMTVNVWDWKNNTKVASNKISFHVRSISIASDGSYFVAVGNR